MKNRLYLNKEIFDEQMIKEAISAYSDLSCILLENYGRYWKCTFKNCRLSTSKTMKEFENYLICLQAREGAGHVFV